MANGEVDRKRGVLIYFQGLRYEDHSVGLMTPNLPGELVDGCQ